MHINLIIIKDKLLMNYFFQLIIKLILAYTITCILFGSCYSVYFILTNKEKINSDKTLNAHSRKLWYIPMVYLSVTLLMTWDLVSSPYNLIKKIIQF